MNVSSYNYLINKPEDINEVQTLALEKVLEEFPYFQSARALRLKGLYIQNSYKYNFALKVTAAHTTDRTVLFDFITSESFIAIQKKAYDKKMSELLEINVIDSEVLLQEVAKKETVPTLVPPIAITVKEEAPIAIEIETKTAVEKLEVGKPIDFSKDETHSFQQWLQISRIQPIDREKETTEKDTQKDPIVEEVKKKKAKLIDKFIETSPKISPVKQGVVFTPNLDLNKEDNPYLMTETLAKVYLEQKKYLKAIQAYEILILKYPEKSSFFADRIKDIKIVQQNNN